MADSRSIAEALLSTANRNPDRVAFISGTSATSIGELLHASAAIRRLLADCRVRAGDRVVLWGDGAHPLEWLASYFAIHLLGAWCVPLNPKIGLDDARFHAGDLEPAAVLAPAALLRRDATSIWADAGIAPARIIGLRLDHGGDQACIGDREVVSLAAEEPGVPDSADGGDIIYTTGTTGRPKGVVLPTCAQLAIGARYAAAQDLARDVVIHSPIPLFTASAIMTLTLPIVAAEAAFSIDHPFDPALALERARARGCTVFKAVPAHYLLIGNAPDIRPLPSVRLAITTAAPLSAIGFEQIRRFFPNAKIRALFGSTESGGAFSIIEEEQLRKSLGSLGTPAPGCAIELQGAVPDAAGGEEGDLVLRGPHAASGYWRREPGIVAATFLADGGVRTGDRAARVAGEYVLRGRTSSTINRGGFKIDPGEIEAIVNRIPWIEESCVVPIAHEVLGEDLLLVVQLKSKTGTDQRSGLAPGPLRELGRVLHAGVPRHKRPRQVLCARLSRNALGKIDRRALQQVVNAAATEWIAIPEEQK